MTRLSPRSLAAFALCASLLLAACGPSEEETPAEDTTPPPVADEPTDTMPTMPTGDTAPRYDVESGIVTYQIVSDFLNGTETVYFDDYGRMETKETSLTITAGGLDQEQQQLTILKDGKIYSIDLTNKTGTVMADEMSAQIAGTVDTESGEEIGPAIMELMGGVESGDGNELGYDCTMWEIADLGSTSCVYKGVPLTASADFGGIALEYNATEAEFNVDVPAEKFEVPADITISQAPPMGDAMPEMDDSMMMPPADAE